MKISKPEVESFEIETRSVWLNSGKRIDWETPGLFDVYYVVWNHEAYCGHQMCGWESSMKNFATLEEAEAFAQKLEEENEVVEWE